jgi:hypothetical protein
MIGRAFDVKHVPLRVPFEVRWTVNYVCGGKPEVANDDDDGGLQFRYILAAGLSNRVHTIRVPWVAQDRASITEYRGYKPPLRIDNPNRG